MQLERIVWNEPGPPVERLIRKQLEDDGFDVVLWHDDAGAAYHPHSHIDDEILWVVFGEMVFTVDGQDYRVGTGDSLILPAGTVHTARAEVGGATYLIAQKKADQSSITRPG